MDRAGGKLPGIVLSQENACNITPKETTRGGGGLRIERGGDARRKFWIKPLKATDLGGAQAFFDT